MKRKLFLLLLLIIPASAMYAQGFYFEYKFNVEGRGDIGGMKTYHQDGNTRTEVNISTGGFTNNLINLMQKASPGKVYQLNADKKTYSVADITQKAELTDYEPADYSVTVLGKEKVNGYNATHVKVQNLKLNNEWELWTTTEIPGFADFSKIKTQYTGKENLTKALTAKGAAGFPVRIKAESHGHSMQTDLVKAGRKNNPAALFSLDGYTADAGASGSSGANIQDMAQKLQNMTPEERQKYIDQLKQQYNQSQPH